MDSTNQYGARDRQIHLFSMMKEIDALLRANGIEYSLTGGSLLGAIRHQGFIPWDDDIDIMIDRENFNKLRRLLSEEKPELKYVMKHDIWVDRIYRAGSTSFEDDEIDVCVVDRVPDNRLLQRIKVILLKTLQGMMKIDVELKDQSLFHKASLLVTHGLGKLFAQERKYRWYQKAAQIGSKRPAGHVAIYTDSFRCLSKQYSGTLMDSYESHTFEDTELRIVKEYDNYLTIQFGDYMTPPPEDKRVPQHLKTGGN